MTETRAEYGSTVEQEFAMQLRAYNIAYETQFTDDRIRGKKNPLPFDFYIKPDILVEVNGGTWARMGHSTGTGIQRDYDKSNLGQLAGFRVFQFTSDDVRSGRAIQFILRAMNLQAVNR
jgi:hypothetical protein